MWLVLSISTDSLTIRILPAVYIVYNWLVHFFVILSKVAVKATVSTK